MSAASLIHYTFLNPSKTISSEKYAQQISEMHRRLQCLQLALVNRKGSVFLHDKFQRLLTKPILQKLNKLSYKVLPHLLYSPAMSPTYYHFFKQLNIFLQREYFQSQQKVANALQEFVKSQGTDFYTTGINKLIAHWPKCIDWNGSYFD